MPEQKKKPKGFDDLGPENHDISAIAHMTASQLLDAVPTLRASEVHSLEFVLYDESGKQRQGSVTLVTDPELADRVSQTIAEFDSEHNANVEGVQLS